MRRPTVAVTAFLLASLWAGAGGGAVTHVVFGLDPLTTFDVYQDRQRIHEGVLSDAIGALAFEGQPGAHILVVPVGRADPVPPIPVHGLAATWSDGIIRLAWSSSPESDVVGYRLLRRRIDQPEPDTLVGLTTTTMWEDRTGVPGSVYAYSAFARDASGNFSPAAGEVITYLPRGPDGADPAGPRLSIDLLDAEMPDRYHGRLRVQWSVSEEEGGEQLAGFLVYRAPVGDPGNDPGSSGRIEPEPGARLTLRAGLLTGPGPHRFEELELPPPGAYRYWIQAVGTEGGSVWLEPLSLITPLGDTGRLGVSPNPTSGPVRVVSALPAAGPVAISLFDVNGRQVVSHEEREGQQGRSEWELDLRSAGGGTVSAGIYFLRLSGAAWSATARIVVLPRSP